MYTEKSLKKMVELAKGVMANAYVPILEFKVGSCLMTEEGKFFSGCNWEMGATPLSQCAESCAISSMISHGYRKISHIVVMAEKVQICPPCGACRQKIHEFFHLGSSVNDILN